MDDEHSGTGLGEIPRIFTLNSLCGMDSMMKLSMERESVLH